MDDMAGIAQERYGAEPEDVLRMTKLARPGIGADEILVRVRASSVDRGTWHAMSGLPYAARAVLGLRRPKAPNPGRNLAGVVVAVGSQVTEFAPGDEVYGTGTATFAEYAAARPDRLATKSAGLTFAQAATVPVCGLTALQAVRDNGRVQHGQRVLVTGAAGGVGTFAVQLAHQYGAEVTAVASTPKLDAVRALGAEHVIDYTHEDFLAGAGATTSSSTSRATAPCPTCAGRSRRSWTARTRSPRPRRRSGTCSTAAPSASSRSPCPTDGLPD